jgi:acyl dehydratase
VVNYAGISGNYHALHADAVRAAEGPFGQRVAHGLLGLTIAAGLAIQTGFLDDSIMAFRELTYKFSKPIFIGDTVYARLAVSKVKSMPRLNAGLVQFKMKLCNQHDQVVQSGTWSVLVRSKSRLRDAADGREPAGR